MPLLNIQLVSMVLIAWGFSSLVYAQQSPLRCDRSKLAVNASQNIEFNIVFHNAFSDQIQVDQGPRTDITTREYRVDGLESAHRVEEQVTLSDEFDLSQSNAATLQSLRFALDNRGGTNPEDHTPSIVSVDRETRVLTVSVDLENKRIDDRRVTWQFQIAQPRVASEAVDPYPTEIAGRTVTRRFNAVDGDFDTSPIAYNKLNTTQYVSAMHKVSACVVKSFELTDDGTYRDRGDFNNPVTIMGDEDSVQVTIHLHNQNSDTSQLQGMLVPELVEAQ